MTDEKHTASEAAAAEDTAANNIPDDPYLADFKDFDWSKEEVVYPGPKKAISIRLDEDVIDFFKQTGKGYQTRINAVLRFFIKHMEKHHE